MGNSRTWCGGWSVRRSLWVFILIFIVAGTALRLLIPPPSAVGMEGLLRAANEVAFFQDTSWLDEQGDRQLAQNVFDGIFDAIENAQRLLVVDMFLFNAWQGPVAETHRALAEELTDRLIAKKRALPDMTIVFISDPINTVYGGVESPQFIRLGEAGIPVVLTPLKDLQDSNPAWSGLWRMLVAPFGNSPGELLPNPFGSGRVSLRSYLALLNFKANHRKLLIADDGDNTLLGIVTSANPHDGSSAHRNVALRFQGEAVRDLLAGELALLELAQAHDWVASIETTLQDMLAAPGAAADSEVVADDLSPARIQLQVLSESRIQVAVLSLLEKAGTGDTVDLAMFYLSDRRIIKELLAAHRRGARLRILLDVNSDAFGRTKNGVPNLPVAAELVDSGIDVRWCATEGEQCHSKWLHVQLSGHHHFLLGSANYTRRNLHDFNLETNVLVLAETSDPIVGEMLHFFEDQWNNSDGRTYSYDYDEYANTNVWLKIQYRFMEYTGLSTF